MGHRGGSRSEEEGPRPRSSGTVRAPGPSVLLLALVAAWSGLAASQRLDFPRAGRAGVLQVDSRIRLPGVTLSEMLPGRNPSLALGRWTGDLATLDGGEIRTRIVRRVPTLWRLRLLDGQEPADLDVRYELIGRDGRPGQLVAAGGAGSEVRVELRPIPPLVVRDGGEEPVLEGGVVFHMDLGSVRSAGRYTGTLTVTLSQL